MDATAATPAAAATPLPASEAPDADDVEIAAAVERDVDANTEEPAFTLCKM